MLAAFLKLRARFKSDERGSVMIIFALSFIAVSMGAGLAIDASRAYHMRTKLGSALDAAALAAGRGLLDGRLSTSDVRDRAKDYFRANLSLKDGESDFGFGSVSEPNIEIDRATGTVAISAEATVPTSIMKLAGINELTFPVATETRFEQKDIELSLALDLTGSMNRNGRLDGLKDATNELVDMLLPPEGTPNEVRIAFAPYSSGVNAGDLSELVTDNSAAGPCTFEREGTTLVSDEVPNSGNYLLEATDAEIGSQDTCPTSSPIVPLTNNRNELQNAISDFRARGFTAGHLGIQWAWFMVSEAWNGVFSSSSAPTPYGQSDTIKAVVVMTDGQFNTVRGSNGNAPLSADLARQMCSAMRDKEVWVFSVGFELNNEDARQVLRDCAGTADRFFLAEDGESLRTAFASIAFKLNNLRLSR